jgi:hypothetical protein
LTDVLNGKDARKSERVMEAILQKDKINIKALRRASLPPRSSEKRRVA